MQLSGLIREYYLKHYTALGAEKMFHFSSRLYSFSDDMKTKALLQDLKNDFVNQDHTHELQTLLQKSAGQHVNVFEKRKIYFEKYPTLYGVELSLFYVRHALFIYGLDLRSQFLKLYPLNKLQELINAVLDDPEAVTALSTYIVNVAYLCFHLFDVRLEREKLTPPYNGKSLNDPDDIRLFIYLYTHCIIGETNFYVRSIPDTDRDFYMDLLLKIEKCIAENFEKISLDSKLEFLVCSKICNYRSTLKSRVLDECNTSVSNEGTFLVDTHNYYTQKTKRDMIGSEHRNVLFIMSDSVFAPHGKTV